MIVRNKRVLVVGMARSGIAAAKLLLKHEAVPILNDTKTADAFGSDLDAFLHTSCEFKLGEDPVLLLPDCDLVVISPGVPLDSPVVAQAQAQGIPLIGEMELAFSLLKGRVIAVTGTNGKTTTVSLLGELFQNAGYTVHVGGNIGYPLSAIAMESLDDDIVVTEVSSFQLETIHAFHPQTAALLNITQDHLNRHHTMENYTRLKFRIFENQSMADTAVLNYDDPSVRNHAEAVPSKHLWFSRLDTIESGVYLRDGMLFFAANGIATPICKPADICIPGPHNLENAMAAIAIAAAYHIPFDIIVRTLRTFAGVEHRIEFVRTVNEVNYINDSKGTNVASTVKAVQSMTVPTVILLGGYDKHVDFSELACAISQSDAIFHAVLLGETAKQLANALTDKEFHSFTHAQTLEEAILIAKNKAKQGGAVLFSPACASFDMFIDYEHRGRVFKDLVNRLPEQDETGA